MGGTHPTGMHSCIIFFLFVVTQTIETMYRRIYDMVALDDDNVVVSTVEPMFLNKSRLTRYNLRTGEAWNTICSDSIPSGMALVTVQAKPLLALSYR